VQAAPLDIRDARGTAMNTTVLHEAPLSRAFRHELQAIRGKSMRIPEPAA
jgi:hypothetical protein